MHIYIHSFIYIHIWYSFIADVFLYRIENWPEWDSNPQPRACCLHSLSKCAIWATMRFA